jgi:sulfide:quinone oxidoreductase
MSVHHQVVIIGAGTGGIMLAARLKREHPEVDIAIIDPNDDHWYQPAWTLVGAGTFNYEATRRRQADYIPKGVKWIKDYATGFLPESNAITTANSGEIHYEALVVAPGLRMDIDALPGLREALQTDRVCSNYVDPQKTWRVLQNFQGGTAVFSQPTTPIKCGGAPQKIMYLAEHYFRKKKIRKEAKVVFATPGSVIFGVKEFANTLMNIVYKRDIILKTFYAPTRIVPEKQEIHFHYTKPGENACVVTEDQRLKEYIEGDSTIILKYDMLHIAPPQAAPDFVRNSVLVHQEGPSKGWLNVDIHTLQHKQFPNIFGLGDVAALPTAKTGAAIRKQVPVLVKNIVALLANQAFDNKQYEGYSSCPLVTGYGEMVLAEFKYDNVVDADPLLGRLFDTTKPLWSMWILKKYMLPWLYWNRMMRGRM